MGGKKQTKADLEAECNELQQALDQRDDIIDSLHERVDILKVSCREYVESLKDWEKRAGSLADVAVQIFTIPDDALNSRVKYALLKAYLSKATLAEFINSICVTTTYKVVYLKMGAQKINMIKCVRELTQMGLKEAKEFVEGREGENLISGMTFDAAKRAVKQIEEAGGKAEYRADTAHA